MARRVLYILILMSYISADLPAQQNKLTRKEYIAKYQDIAIKEMARTGIPASIKIAQGILESNNGNSRLATKANNHFGIKCHDWDGRKIRHDDDASRECFRKYSSVEESYHDHSDFLTSKSRYAKLFELASTDYRQWAIGLRKAGYATSPTYADALIKIIEENKLYLLDQGVEISDKKDYTEQKPKRVLVDKQRSSREVFENNRVKYIIAKSSDTYSSLTEELEMLPWQLAKYNELPQNFNLTEGQIIYIQPKRVNSDPRSTVHVVAEGETMYLISQKYAIRLDKLYSRNLMKPGTEPETGIKLLLRGKANTTMKKSQVGSKKEEAAEENEFKFEFDLE